MICSLIRLAQAHIKMFFISKVNMRLTRLRFINKPALSLSSFLRLFSNIVNSVFSEFKTS